MGGKGDVNIRWKVRREFVYLYDILNDDRVLKIKGSNSNISYSQKK